jgi:hypothetical protein
VFVGNPNFTGSLGCDFVNYKLMMNEIGKNNYILIYKNQKRSKNMLEGMQIFG